ncbi:MAG: glutathione S-transferase family protein [Xanthomonadales bacterium]|nr:glutathione S-transferase family protein [Xanthomonadales bacterium]
MGMLVEGQWRRDVDTLVDEDGRLQRPDSVFRNWVTADGSAGPTGQAGFAAEPGRYHLYLSRACPWAHRTAIFRELKGLQGMIDISVTHWLMADDGWTFNDAPGVIADPVLGAEAVWQIYVASQPDYSGRVSVPVLWDKTGGVIVSNESADIIRMFNSAFDGVGALPGDWYPAPLRERIDALNERIYEGLNNGVYKAGFASSQRAYDQAVAGVFDTLDWLEGVLDGQPWLCGEQQTEADWRLFTTLVRFDAVYHGHFKCNLRRLVDYPRLWAWTRRLYQHPAVATTIDFDHIKRHYYASHRHINPTGIVPAGPVLDWRRKD